MAMIEFGGAVLAVSNDEVYRIDSNGNETLVGSISFLSPSVACSKPLSGDIRHRLWRMGQQRNIFDAGYRP